MRKANKNLYLVHALTAYNEKASTAEKEAVESAQDVEGANPACEAGGAAGDAPPNA